ncbi:MAG: hypothetical protein CL828_05030 [Crocinitomicaceae bacterium]|nr:hypothetical protein [Crocinitomicaceae bacterium]
MLGTIHHAERRRTAGYIAAAGIVAALGWSVYPDAETPLVPKENQKQTRAADAPSNPFPQSNHADGATSVLATNSDTNSDTDTDNNSIGNPDAAANDTQKSSTDESPAIEVNDILTPSVPLNSKSAAITTSTEMKIEPAHGLIVMDLLLFMDPLNPPESSKPLAAALTPMAIPTGDQSMNDDGNRRSFNLRVYQGLNWSKFSYLEQDGANLLAQNDNMKSNGSWSVGAMIEFDALRQKWGAGIEWNEFVHQLNYNRTFEQFNTIDGALLQVEVDPNTGDTVNSVYGAAEVLVVAQRRVVHHNRLRTITIPLEWQNQWSLTPILRGGFALGALVHWRASLSGRTFTEHEGNMVDYGDAEFPSNRITLAPMLRMHATCDIAPDWSIELSARMASLNHASRPSAELPDQSGQFKGRLLTGNLFFGVARAIR